MRQHLDRVRVAADLASATVDGREVTASGPKALRKALADALYEAFHTGGTPKEDQPRRPPGDPAFEQVLRAMVPHPGTRVLAPVEPGAPDVVRLGGVRVLIPEQDTAAGGEAGQTRWVTLPSVMPALSPGFLLVNGSAGHGLDEGACVRVYAAAERPDAAPGLWGAILARLEELGLRYRAKVLSIRGHYPRRDSIVVYLGPRSWHAVPEIARAATAAGGLRPDLSAYVAPLGPGLGWAWEPHDPRPGMRGLSFGEHRSHAVAAGLLAHAEHGGDLERTVDEELRAAGITPGAPHRNLDSPPLLFETSGHRSGPGSHEIKERG
ncbi:T3SS effector HopA1 family protein [Nonomuraea sp. CA-218870]|uniref:T3SS effector HopA1 family protein n=1 Tax=Nonomuraea sp. CA-218870 TaxID=3239998 RepID=UPI003D9316A9